MSGPRVMFGTKCPSITSIWIQSPPARSIARTSSPSLAKSADRMEGAIRIGLVMSGPVARGLSLGNKGQAPSGRLDDLRQPSGEVLEHRTEKWDRLFGLI